MQPSTDLPLPQTQADCAAEDEKAFMSAQKRFGYGQEALIIMALPLVAMLNATVMSMAANTR